MSLTTKPHSSPLYLLPGACASLACAFLISACVSSPTPPSSGAIPHSAALADGEEIVPADEMLLAEEDISSSRCNAAPAQQLANKMVSLETVEEARQLSGARLARLIQPDQHITRDHQSDRLNLQLNQQGRIVRIFCD